MIIPRPHIITTENGGEFLWWSKEFGAALELEVLQKLYADGIIDSIVYDAPFIKIDGKWIDGEPPGRLQIANREGWRRLQDR